jgi:hypothetical protein
MADPAFPAGEKPSSGGAWGLRAAAGWLPLHFPQPVLCGCFICCFLCCLRYSFPLRKTSVFRIVLCYLLSAVHFSDSNNVFTVSTIFWWLLQVSSGDAVGLVVICFPFTFETALCGPLKGPDHLIVQFLTFCIYFNAISVWFGFNIDELTPFSLKKKNRRFILALQPSNSRCSRSSTN